MFLWFAPLLGLAFGLFALPTVWIFSGVSLPL